MELWVRRWLTAQQNSLRILARLREQGVIGDDVWSRELKRRTSPRSPSTSISTSPGGERRDERES